ncbi:MAG: hypothetical protein J5858_13755 [Lentisphaeria bacterium]|nr:hypothetical protein [Lentisphaeria bacterium]
MLTADLPHASFASDTPSVDSYTLKTEHFTLRTLPVEIGELSEAMALAAKRRLHNSEDGKELMFETLNTIPFGAEPQIQRKIKISDGLICVTMDMVMRASCPLTELSAGGFVISGSIRKFGLILPPEKGCLPAAPEKRDFTEIPENGGVIHDAPFPPLGIVLESDKERFDWTIGDDLWRWTNAERIGGGKARFVITREQNSIRMQWKLFEKLPVKNGDDTPIPGRNWRLTWAAAWKPLSCPRKKKAAAAFDLAACDCGAGARAVSSIKKNSAGERVCCCASATLNALKKWLRAQLGQIQEGSVLEIRNVQPVYCVNAGHVDRAKYNSLPHWDMMSLIEFRRWANRMLGAKNASLRILAPEKSPWKAFMILD